MSCDTMTLPIVVSTGMTTAVECCQGVIIDTTFYTGEEPFMPVFIQPPVEQPPAEAAFSESTLLNWWTPDDSEYQDSTFGNDSINGTRSVRRTEKLPGDGPGGNGSASGGAGSEPNDPTPNGGGNTTSSNNYGNEVFVP